MPHITKRAVVAMAVGALLAMTGTLSRAQVPVFDIDHANSSVKFNVNASVPVAGTFENWDATITLSSAKATSAVLDIQIQAASVNTGSGMKDGKLKGKDFFDAKTNPVISFHSTKVTEAGPNMVVFEGDFTIRGVTKSEKLTFTIDGKGTGSGSVNGTMAFDRKEYGMNSGIPFIKIADRVEVTVKLQGKRVSGPPVVRNSSRQEYGRNATESQSSEIVHRRLADPVHWLASPARKAAPQHPRLEIESKNERKNGDCTRVAWMDQISGCARL
jgi:polyisoprenoid-binding protein YceI